MNRLKELLIAGAMIFVLYTLMAQPVPVIRYLRDLLDVGTAIPPANGDVLTYNSAIGNWTNAAGSGGGGSSETNAQNNWYVTNLFYVSGKGNSLTITQSITIQNGGTLNLFGANISGDAYVIIGGSSIALTNGLNLLTAYASAKTKTPHGNALSAQNRYTIFLLPGIFDMGASSVTLDTQFIDLIGVSQNTGERLAVTATDDLGDTIITSSTKPINVTAASQDITIANLCLKTTTASTESCIETSQSGFQAGFKVINVFLAYAGSGNRITQWDKSFNGYWEDVRACDVTGSTSSRAFGSSVAGAVTVAGTFIRCIAEDAAWGGENNNGVTLSGTFIDCRGGTTSFGGSSNGGTLSGIFLRCRPGASNAGMFGGTSGTLSGTFDGCQSPAGVNSWGSTLSGSMRNCAGAAPSCSVISGTYIGCEFDGFTANKTASRALDTAVTIAATGWTNTFGKNATVYFDGTNITATVKNSAGTAVYTNTAPHLQGIGSVNLQPSGAVVLSGTGVNGRAVPF